MKNGRCIFSCLVCAVICANLCFYAPAGAADHQHGTAITADTASITQSGSWYLSEDVKLSGSLTISGDIDVELCLNGHMLTASSGIAVKNGASLTLTDCCSSETHQGSEFTHGCTSAVSSRTIQIEGGVVSAEGRATVFTVSDGACLSIYGGTVMGGKHTQGVGGGGIYIYGGTLNVCGGVIRDNMAAGESGGAIGAMYSKKNSTVVNISGGEITCNASDTYAAAIYAANGGAGVTDGIVTTYGTELNISGGYIHGNSEISAGTASSPYAAGVYVGKYCSLNMTGGRISENHAAGSVGGVYLSSYAKSVNVSGSAVISDNHAGCTVSATGVVNAEGPVCNLYISRESTVTGAIRVPKVCIPAPMSAGASVGVTYAGDVEETVDVLYPDGYTITGSDVSKFFSDNESRSLALNDGTIVICAGRMHYICGVDCTHAEKHGTALYSPLDEDFSGGDLAAGSYYLTKDVELSQPITVSGQVNICLEGFEISNLNSQAFTVPNGGELNICDCYSGQTDAKYSHTFLPASSGSVTVWGGVIKGSALRTSGGVLVDGGKFNLFGGTIAGANNSGGVRVINGGKFSIYGGAVSHNHSKTNGGGVYADAGSSVAVYGGSITNNYAGSFGGGVYAENGFTLAGEVYITGNTAQSRSNNSNVYIPNGKYINVTGPVTGKVCVTMERDGIFTAGGAAGSIGAFDEDAAFGTFVGAADGELTIETYGVAEQPTTESPTVTMKSPERVQAYQWYMTAPGTEETWSGVFSAAGKFIDIKTVSLSAGDTLKITARDGAADGVSLMKKTANEDGEELLVPAASSYTLEEGAFFVAAPADGEYTFRMLFDADQAAGRTVDITVLKYTIGAAVDNQTAATYTGSPGWRICRAEYTDGVTVIYSNPMRSASHTHGDAVYTPAANAADGGLMIGDGEADSLTLPAGNYFLAADLTLDGPLKVDSGTVSLCLHGHTLKTENGTAIVVSAGAELNICDCAGGGKISGINTAGTVTIDGCEISGGSAAHGGGMYISGGKVTLDGTKISGNTAENGGGVYLSGGELELSGKIEITGNEGGNLHIAQGQKIIISESFSDESQIGVSCETAGVFAEGELEAYQKCFTSEAKGYFIYTEKNAGLSADEYAITTQPTASACSVEVNCETGASYQWYEAEPEPVADESNERYDGETGVWTAAAGGQCFTAPLSENQILRIIPQGPLPEGTKVKLDGIELTGAESGYTAGVAETKNYTLAFEFPAAPEAPVKFTAEVYTVAGPLEGQTASSLSAGAGAYVCRVTYPDGTVLQSDLVIVQPPAAQSGAGSKKEWKGFEDVHEGKWYYESVKSVCEAGIMVGTGDTEFSPDGVTTRGMMTVILWRISGEPAADGEPGFVDVDRDSYCYEAVRWAAAQGIILGFDAWHFGPDQPVTREQLAAMLYRFEKYSCGSVRIGGPENWDDLSGFADKPAKWSEEAVRWAVEMGIIQGKQGNLLDAGGGATRAETAVIIDRYLKWQPV